MFDRQFFDMPRGTPSQWRFEAFKQQAIKAGGVVSDELLAEFKEDMAEAIRRESDDDEQSYIPLELMQ